MSTNRQVAADEGGNEGASPTRDELATQLELLAEENRQLRESYTQAKRTTYRQTALGLAVVGLGAVAGALLVPRASTILFALGGIGLFGGVLTYFLTPEQFVSADVGRDVYATLAGNEAALVGELGLSDERRYVPLETGDSSVRLFVPQHESAAVPDDEALTQTIVVPDDGERRGLALDPSGTRLFRAFEEALTGPVSAAPGELGDQLTEALVEQFELARSASAESDPDEGRLTVAIGGSVYGPLDTFDHPIASFLAVGLARGLDRPISLSVTEQSDGDVEALVTCRWDETDEAGE
ncbi:hypothetical protein ACFQGE_10465 [Halomicroarcula sp. GCM10025817]|uniref:hypothetical protein n=1 Tax=Haloarcula TaxID=2237 RepID=UPI0023E8B7DF|nr:hypothetical protein [Halomicroarcula sp. SYNS111]